MNAHTSLLPSRIAGWTALCLFSFLLPSCEKEEIFDKTVSQQQGQESLAIEPNATGSTVVSDRAATHRLAIKLLFNDFEAGGGVRGVSE
jgi:hypothetical protein